MQQLGSHVYSQQQPTAGEGVPPSGEGDEQPGEKPDEGTVEGEFREV